MQYLWDEKSSQCLALFIDIRIASARKVDSFKGTRCALYLFCNSMERNLAIFSIINASAGCSSFTISYSTFIVVWITALSEAATTISSSE